MKFINKKCITLCDFCQGKKSKGLRMKLLETMVEKTQFKVEVLTMDTSSSE